MQTPVSREGERREQQQKKSSLVASKSPCAYYKGSCLPRAEAMEKVAAGGNGGGGGGDRGGSSRRGRRIWPPWALTHLASPGKEAVGLRRRRAAAGGAGAEPREGSGVDPQDTDEFKRASTTATSVSPTRNPTTISNHDRENSTGFGRISPTRPRTATAPAGASDPGTSPRRGGR
jgi:hypothetical protein